jgi:hypothetical protein
VVSAQISQIGTMTEKKGSWRPIMPLSFKRSSPVTVASAITGVGRCSRSATGRRPPGGEKQAQPDQHGGGAAGSIGFPHA